MRLRTVDACFSSGGRPCHPTVIRDVHSGCVAPCKNARQSSPTNICLRLTSSTLGVPQLPRTAGYMRIAVSTWRNQKAENSTDSRATRRRRYPQLIAQAFWKSLCMMILSIRAARCCYACKYGSDYQSILQVRCSKSPRNLRAVDSNTQRSMLDLNSDTLFFEAEAQRSASSGLHGLYWSL